MHGKNNQYILRTTVGMIHITNAKSITNDIFALSLSYISYSFILETKTKILENNLFPLKKD